MDGVIIECREFGEPTPQVLAVGIEFSRLGNRIEDAEIGCGIHAGPGHPLPPECIVGNVGVDERMHEPRGALAPMDAHVLGQPRGHDHAHAVVHPSLMPQLSHAGIHQRHAGPAAPPRVQPDGIFAPFERIETRIEVPGDAVRPVMQHVMREFAPAQFRNEFVHARAAMVACRVQHRARADLAKMQMRRQSRGAIDAGPVTIPGICREAIQERVQSSLGARFSG